MLLLTFDRIGFLKPDVRLGDWSRDAEPFDDLVGILSVGVVDRSERLFEERDVEELSDLASPKEDFPM